MINSEGMSSMEFPKVPFFLVGSVAFFITQLARTILYHLYSTYIPLIYPILHWWDNEKTPIHQLDHWRLTSFWKKTSIQWHKKKYRLQQHPEGMGWLISSLIPNHGISGIYIILLLEVDEPFRRWCSSVEKVYTRKINNSNKCLVQKPVFVCMDVYMSTSDAKLHMLEHAGNDCANLQSFWQLTIENHIITSQFTNLAISSKHLIQSNLKLYIRYIL